MELEDEAHRAVAKAGRSGAGEAGEVDAADRDRPGIGPIERAEQVQEGRLPRSRRADHGDDLTRRDVEIGAAQDLDLTRAVAVCLDHAAGLDGDAH